MDLCVVDGLLKCLSRARPLAPKPHVHVISTNMIHPNHTEMRDIRDALKTTRRYKLTKCRDTEKRSRKKIRRNDHKPND